MKGTIKLKTPITVNGQQVAELTYDTEEITADLFSAADAHRRIAAGKRNVTIVPTAELDFALHPYLGYAAVIAVNPQYDFSDLERVKGSDMLKVMEIGRNFILRSDASTQKTSDEPSETTAAPTTAASPISEKDV